MKSVSKSGSIASLPFWPLDLVATWIIRARDRPVERVAQHSTQTTKRGRASSGFMLLHIEAGLMGKLKWWVQVEEALRKAGRRGLLAGAIRDAKSGVEFVPARWDRVRILPGRAGLDLFDGKKLHRVIFDRVCVKKIWKGLRGRRTALEKQADALAPDRAETARRESLRAEILRTIEAGEIPSRPLEWLEKTAQKHNIGLHTARPIRRKAIAAAKARGLPAAEAWGRRGRKRGSSNTVPR